jgi:hypothetical protein
VGRIVFEEAKMAIKLEISSVHGTFSTLNTFQMSSGDNLLRTFSFATLSHFSENEQTSKLVSLLAGVNLLRFL